MDGESGANVRTTLADVPWLPEYSLGAGIDILRSSLKASPFESVQLETADSGVELDGGSKLITKTEHLKSYLKTSSNFSASIPFGIATSAGMDFVSKVQCSETSVTFIRRSERLYKNYQRIKPIFTPEAKNILKNNPKRFREMYGDYYVDGCKKGSSFVALYVFTSSSSSSMKSFLSDGELVNAICAFQAKADVKYSSCLKNIRISVHMYASGVNEKADIPVMAETVEDVQAAYAKYLDSIEYVNSKALLCHYHVREPCFLPTIGIQPNALTEIQELLVQIQMHQHTLEKVHHSYRSDVRCKWDHLTRMVAAHNLVSHSDERAKLLKEAQSIEALIEGIDSREDFYKTVVEEKKKETPNTFSTPVKECGITSCEWQRRGVIITEDSKSIRVKQDTTPKDEEIGKRGRLIVGWSVSRQRETGKWKLPRKLLLSSTGTVTFYGAGWWEVTVWSVATQDYNFTQ